MTNGKFEPEYIAQIKLKQRQELAKKYPFLQQFLPPIPEEPEVKPQWWHKLLGELAPVGATTEELGKRTGTLITAPFYPEIRERIQPSDIFPTKAEAPEIPMESLARKAYEETKMPWGVKGAAEEAIYLPLYLLGIGGAAKAVEGLTPKLLQRVESGLAKIAGRKLPTTAERQAMQAYRVAATGQEITEEALLKEAYGLVRAGAKVPAKEAAEVAARVAAVETPKLTAQLWNKMSVQERVMVAQEAGLSGRRGWAIWKNLSKDEVKAVQDAWAKRTQLKPPIVEAEKIAEEAAQTEVWIAEALKDATVKEQLADIKAMDLDTLTDLGRYVESRASYARAAGASAEAQRWTQLAKHIRKVAEEQVTAGIKPPKPPVKPPTAIAAAPAPEPQDVVKKLIEFIKKMKPVRREYEELKGEALRVKSAKLAKALETKTGEEAHEAIRRARAGKLPKPEEIPISEVAFTPEEVSALKEIIRTTKALPDISENVWLRGDIMDALDNLLQFGKIPTARELRLLEQVFPEIGKVIAARRSMGRIAWEATLDALNFPKAIRASWDISALYRQGALILTDRPQQIPAAFKAQIKSIVSDQWARETHQACHATAWECVMDDALLYRPDFWTAVGKVTEREEAFMSHLARWVPGVKRSERAYVVGLNKIRTDFFVHQAEQWNRMGVKANASDYQRLARAVNILTGRGDIKRLEEALGALNAVFFSPRFQMSRLMTPTLLFDRSPLVRRMAARVTVKFFSFWATVFGAIKMAGVPDLSVEINPLSSDFGKVRYKNTRFDPVAGYAPWMRYVARVLWGKTKTGAGRIRDADLIKLTTTLVRTKLSPGMTPLIDWRTGRSLTGEEVKEMPALRQLQEYWSPLAIQAVLEAAEEEGFAGSGLALPEFIGVGVMTYDTSSQLVGEIRTLRSDIQRLTKKFDELQETGTGEEIEKFYADHPELEYIEYIADIDRQIGRLEETEKAIKEDKTLSQEQKAMLLDDIRREIEMIAIDALAAIGELPVGIRPPSGGAIIRQSEKTKSVRETLGKLK